LHYGVTQIERVLAHALRENQRQKIKALVFVGDAMEEREDTLFAIARELGARCVPVFAFQEGDHPEVSRVFAEIAKLSKGAHCHFTPGAARELAELLRAVAAYAAGGRRALLGTQTAAAAKLLLQLPPR
jgi:cytosine/adenosine deaminase-related metal-dependent hydrolase